MEVIKKGFMFLVSGHVTYTEKDDPVEKSTTVDGLKYLDHEVVWAEDLDEMYKALAINFNNMHKEANIKLINLISISMLGHCTKEDWMASRDRLIKSATEKLQNKEPEATK